MTTKQVRGQYTQEFKLAAVRQVRAGQGKAVVGKVLGIPRASVGNWVRLAVKASWMLAWPMAKIPQRPGQASTAAMNSSRP